MAKNFLKILASNNLILFWQRINFLWSGTNINKIYALYQVYIVQFFSFGQKMKNGQVMTSPNIICHFRLRIDYTKSGTMLNKKYSQKWKLAKLWPHHPVGSDNLAFWFVRMMHSEPGQCWEKNFPYIRFIRYNFFCLATK